MPSRKEAIIIGSGIGGAAIGALLAHQGWKVLVLEKNRLIGGRCASYEKDGFIVDLGVHLFGVGDKGALGDICRRIDMSYAIDWVTIKVPSLRVKDSVKRYSRQSMMEMLPEKEMENLGLLFMQVFQLSEEDLEQLWYVPLAQWMNQFTQDKLAHSFIEMINAQYFCVRHEVASTAEFIKCFKEVVMAKSSAYPRGGCQSIPQAYLSAVTAAGGEIKTKARVSKVIVENHKAVGVRMEDGYEFRAPVIISNADIKTTVSRLVGEEHFPDDYVKKVQKLTYAFHALGLKVALSEKITDDQLLMYMPYDYEEAIIKAKEAMEGTLPDLIGGMITSPTNYDPSLAPEGRQMIFFGAGCPPDQDWSAWEEVMLNSFYRVYPAAKGKVLWYRLDTPDLVAQYAGENGNIIGVGQTVDQIHQRRPSVVTPLEGLYLSSAEAGGHGIGTELAADSARELFEVLKKKENTDA